MSGADGSIRQVEAALKSGAAFHVVNLGCKVNRVESDTISAAFAAYGAESAEEACADVIVVNTCTVTGEADKKARKAVRHALSVAPDATVVVTGCSVAIDPAQYERMSERVHVIQRADLLYAFSSGAGREPLRLGEGYRTRVPIKVQDGCNRACTYCIVHVARGPAKSTAVREVLAEAERYLAGGVKEIVLTGIDLGSYDDGGMRLHHLVAEILERADKHAAAGERPARVRASSLEPHSLTDEFVDLLAASDGQLCRHLHLPLQAGSSRVLREMARPYSAQRFGDIVAELRQRVPQMSITTDIICGFPGETDEDFTETLALAKSCRFSKIHVFPYSMRAGTPAAQRKDQVPSEVKAARCELLRSLSDELRAADLASRAGTAELVVVEGATALTESYHEIAAPAGTLPGDLVSVTL